MCFVLTEIRGKRLNREKKKEEPGKEARETQASEMEQIRRLGK